MLNDQPLYGHPQYVLTGDNGLPIPITIRQWLDNPTNMNTLWSMAKKIINDLPPPRNVGDLARILDRLFRIIRLRLQLLMELYRGRANPTIYQGQRPLIGPDCRDTVLRLVYFLRALKPPLCHKDMYSKRQEMALVGELGALSCVFIAYESWQSNTMTSTN